MRRRWRADPSDICGLRFRWLKRGLHIGRRRAQQWAYFDFCREFIVLTLLRMAFLALAVWGAIHPMYHFIGYMQETGTGLSGLIDAWYVNGSTTGLVWDLTIAAIALTVFVIAESVRQRNWIGLIAVPATFCIGVSCGLPLYLFLRSRPSLLGKA